MSTTIFLVKCSGGEYDDKYSYIIKGWSKRESADGHVEQLKLVQKGFNDLVPIVKEFVDKWETEHPGPEPFKFIQEPKWPSGLSKDKITAEMRAERDEVRAQNNKRIEQYQTVSEAHSEDQTKAVKEFLSKIPSAEPFIEEFTSSFYCYEKSEDFSIKECELD